MGMDKNFDAAKEEQRIADLWQDNKAFAAGAGKRREDAFSIMLPPPNVTGVLHAGHAFNQTLMDILVRWHRMRGFDTLFQPGQDHAGIATQMVVEREMAKEGLNSRANMSREDFIAKIWEWKKKSGGTIISQMKRLGASCDWDRNAFTMSGAASAPEGEEGNFHEAVIRVFVDLFDKGLIYRGKRLVNWDPHFQTAISDVEVENLEVQGHMWHFKYPLADGATYKYVEKDSDGNVVLEEERDYISIATTRPETMLGDGAIAVHIEDERYAPIVGKYCEIPVGPKAHRRLIPIITDPYPDPEFGSGAVKITGAHDFNDHEVAQRAQLPMYRLLHWDGSMRRDGLEYHESVELARKIAHGELAFDEALVESINLVPDNLRGLDRFDARKHVVEEIIADGLAVMTNASDTRLGRKAQKPDTEGADAPVPLIEAKAIMQPFGDRSKVVIEPMLTDQWFVDTAKIVGPAIDAVRNGDTRIMPAQHEKVYFHWLDNIEPWCISRQLWWGHQIPVWYDEDGNHYCAVTLEEAQAKAPGKTLTQDPDVLDTWFSSGLWPIGTLGWPDNTPEMNRYFPSSVLITGFDILFFWVARMMMMQYAVVDQKPFKDVYVHALVRDDKGKKMSKSLGNVLDPIDLIDEYGADAVRFTFAAMAAMGRDLKLSTARIQGYRNFGTKLWNAARFAEMNGAFSTPASALPPTPQAAVNAWIIAETAAVYDEVDAALSAYRFNDAANAAYAFVWGKVCDWYVEFAKPLLRGEAQDETRATMGWVIDQCIKLLHPFMPFITESLWGGLRHRDTVLALTEWPEGEARGRLAPDAMAEMRWVIAAIEGIRSARASLRVPAGLTLPVICSGMDDEAARYWTGNAALIEKLARTEPLIVEDGLPKDAIVVTLDGATLGLPVGDVIDIGAERDRLQKSHTKLEKEVLGLEKRLNNPAFVDSAPDEVVEETRSNHALRSDELSRLSEALDRLKAMSE